MLKIAKDRFVSDQVGAAFFFGEIITEASGVGLENGQRLFLQSGALRYARQHLSSQIQLWKSPSDVGEKPCKMRLYAL